MSAKLATLEEFMKKYINNQASSRKSDSFEVYKHKNGIDYDRKFYRALESLYSDKNKNLATYGQNSRDISNKGLQNSGYAEYINDRASTLYNSKLENITSEKNLAQSKALSGYASYLESYTKKLNELKDSVTNHLINNNVVNLDDAISYAIGRGLEKEDAIAVSKNAYSVNRQSVFNSILSQVTNLGLDKSGAIMLAKKMGVSNDDAEAFGEEIEELLKHYGSISKEYLDYLEQQSNKATNTFN